MDARTGLAFLNGFLLGAGLIVAIGAQNAFVLRQGLLRSHVFAVALVCTLADAVLIAVGVFGLAGVAVVLPGFEIAARIGGALFLAGYGWLAARRALRPGRLEAAAEARMGLAATLILCLGFTVLNPHVYLDTVVLIGSIGTGYDGAARVAYAAGAAAASAVWFFGLGYGARLLAPLFRTPAAWRLLDAAIAVVMWGIAGSLAVALIA
jgi:L-lysine exporter family protein LysE/ArgO